MLSREENEFICRTGPGTPMGEFMRQYWIPGLLSEEVPAADSDPVRILLLNEKLIAFRDTNGKVGVIQNHCPHRGASLFFGRNEEAGIRCVYHGWKFAVDGTCVDMPNEPAESDFKAKVKAVAYPTQERGGVVWVYMGPLATPPPLPELEANVVDGASAYAIQHDHNWLQVLEGTIDTVHAVFLHAGSISPDDQPPGTFAEWELRQRSTAFEGVDTPIGACYAARRDATPGNNYWRIAQFLMPFYGMSPASGGLLGAGPSALTACVPMDDEHTLYVKFAAVSGGDQNRPARANRTQTGGWKLLPNTTDWHGRFLSEANTANDYLLDRELQRRNQGNDGYSGIPGARQQDRAITSSMGPIYDRTQEHLGTTDSLIIRARRRLIEAARAFAQSGKPAPGAESPELYRVRSGQVLLPKSVNWVEATEEKRTAFTDHADLDWSLTRRGRAASV
jgi:phenylpropionate dioxygenase-like ring-hydroxylating dioxygenase large terminal subunit